MSTVSQPKPVYLDYAAATPVDGRVLSAMRPYWSDIYANPSALTASAGAARRTVEDARRRVARQIGAKPYQIIFTSGATEANNLALKGAMAKLGGHLLVSAVEHESVLEPARQLKHDLIPVNKYGELEVERLKKLIGDRTSLISVIHVSNETGVIQPLAEIAGLIREVRRDRIGRGVKRPLLLHSDAAQSPLTNDIKAHRLGTDLMTLSAQKIYGPKGAGCLYVRDPRWLSPQMHGGGQELGLRSGTEPVPQIVGFAAALELAALKRPSRQKKFQALYEHLIARLAAKQPDVRVNAPSRHRAPHIVSLLVPGADGEALVMALDQRGIEVATGSACAAAGDAPSHVLTALGLTRTEAAATLRISFGTATTVRDLDRFVAALGEVR
jgi:cysteine desulfurase